MMRGFVVTAPHCGEVRELPVPEPEPDGVIVAPAFVGICGTDYRIFRGTFPSRYPLVIGHEFSGTITAVGRGVHGWREGDRVAVDPSLWCGVCAYCRRDQTNHCDRWEAIGDTVDGALAELVRVPARNLFRVAEHEHLEDAAFTEPLACVLWGLERLRVRPGDRALIFGAGPIGALMAQMLSWSPTIDVVVVDVAEEKLAVARALGARATELAGEGLAPRLRARSQGRGYDLVIDCTGDPDVMRGLFAHAGPGARIMIFGVASPDAEIRISPFDVYHQDWEIIGSMAINGTFQQARDLIAEGRVLVRPLLSRIGRLDDVESTLAVPKAPGELKVLIAPS